MNKKLIYVGVDFSLNSTAICINDGELKFINFINTDTLLTKKGDRPLAAFEHHYAIKDFIDLNYCPRAELPKDYAEEQIRKLKDYDYLTDLITSYLPKGSIIGLEGFSYASNGQGYIDLVMAQSILRYKISRVKDLELVIIPPSKIKKFFTGKGNANKVLMAEAFQELKIDHPLFKYTKKNTIVKGKEIVKPIDDLIDAYAIQKFLEGNIK